MMINPEKVQKEIKHKKEDNQEVMMESNNSADSGTSAY